MPVLAALIVSKKVKLLIKSGSDRQA